MSEWGVGMPASHYLDEFGGQVERAFGKIPYLVGSARASKTWRDVDVRLILPDDEYAAWGFGNPRHPNKKRCAMEMAFAALGKHMTGLPIDFQIQQRADANERFKGSRNALIPASRFVYDEPDPVAATLEHIEEKATGYMTRADELLRELLAATDELEGMPLVYGVAMRIGYAQKSARAYLNEKPHEHAHFLEHNGVASPPHAAAEPVGQPTDPVEKKIWDVFQRVGGLAIPHVWSAFRKGWKEAEYAAQPIDRAEFDRMWAEQQDAYGRLAEKYDALLAAQPIAREPTKLEMLAARLTAPPFCETCRDMREEVAGQLYAMGD